MAVVDASVIVASVLPSDPNHIISKKWLDTLIKGRGQFSAPVILLSEVAAPLSRAYNQSRQAKQLVQVLVNTSFFNLVTVTEPLAKRAAVIAADNKIRGCDSIYVALAEALGEELVTLDRQQRERAKTLIRAISP